MRHALAAGAAIAVLAIIAFVGITSPAGSAKPPLASATVLVTVVNGSGSGVMLDGGYILTAAHVARISPDKIMISTDGGEDTTRATILWISNEFDLALLKVWDEAFVATIAPAQIACRTAEIGEDVTAEGNPMGVKFVTQWGKVGSKVQRIGHWRQAFSIGAPLAPGMSGGPVYDAEGFVVGTNVGVSPVGGLYLAVPSSAACLLMGRA